MSQFAKILTNRKNLIYLPIVFLSLSSCSVYLNPASFPFASLISLSFPIWLILSLITLLFSVLDKKVFLVYFVGLIINYYPIYNFFPFHIVNSVENSDLKIASYNVHNFRIGNEIDTIYQKQFISAFKDLQTDMIFYQEGGQARRLKDDLLDKYPYQLNTMTKKNSNIGVFSKYPILSLDIIDTTSSNTSAIFYIQLPSGDTLSVLNCHLASFKLKDNYFNISKFLSVSRQRAEQVDSICRFLDKHDTSNMIVLGDFNEIPNSYSHRKFTDRLTDCFTTSGLGLGSTYRKFLLPLRIDHIFCGNKWEPKSCQVYDKYDLSDHYPIIATLRKKEI